MLADGLVMSNIVYMIQVYGQASDYLLRILQVQQNRAARAVTRLAWGTSTHHLLNQIGWLSVRQLYVYHSLLLLWKIRISGQTSIAMGNLCKTSPTVLDKPLVIVCLSIERREQNYRRSSLFTILQYFGTPYRQN